VVAVIWYCIVDIAPQMNNHKRHEKNKWYYLKSTEIQETLSSLTCLKKVYNQLQHKNAFVIPFLYTLLKSEDPSLCVRLAPEAQYAGRGGEDLDPQPVRPQREQSSR
jgi:hypothetical protein